MRLGGSLGMRLGGGLGMRLGGGLGMRLGGGLGMRLGGGLGTRLGGGLGMRLGGGLGIRLGGGLGMRLGGMKHAALKQVYYSLYNTVVSTQTCKATTCTCIVHVQVHGKKSATLIYRITVVATQGG